MPSNTITKLIVSFENVEQVTIDASVLLSADFGELSQELKVYENKTIHINIPEYIEMELDKSMFAFKNLDMREMHMYNTKTEEENIESVKKHFKVDKNIVSITLVNAIHEELLIVAPWLEPNPNKNDYMKFEEKENSYLLTIRKENESVRPIVFMKKTSVENLK